MGVSACPLATFGGFVRKLGIYILSSRMCVLNFGMYILCLRMERGEGYEEIREGRGAISIGRWDDASGVGAAPVGLRA